MVQALAAYVGHRAGHAEKSALTALAAATTPEEAYEESKADPDFSSPQPEGGLAVIGTRRYLCGGDIGWPDDVPTVAL